MYSGFVVKVEKLKPHPNADKLQIATFFESNVCVDLNVKIGDIGIYFPTDGQLSEEYCKINKLLRKDGGYLDSNKRNVTTIKLRNELSDGLYMPLSSVQYTGINNLSVGDYITVLNGHEICRKYIPYKKENLIKINNKKKNKTKRKINIAPLFKEHVDTKQLVYSLAQIHPGDKLEITLKMHGTSGRTGYLPKLKKYKRTLWERIFGLPGKPIYEYEYMSGTRRTILNDNNSDYYGNNKFRYEHEKKFIGKLHKGETVYYEIVGFIAPHKPIMPIGNNKKLKDEEFIRRYGETTVFSYGCNEEKGESRIYVYRMTMTNEDGYVLEYSPDFMRYRCKQIGVKAVPLLFFTRASLIFENNIMEIVNSFCDGSDPIGKTHIREGVVVRVVNRPTFTAFKYKNNSFKRLEGIIKAEADMPDIEEMEELSNGEIYNT